MELELEYEYENENERMRHDGRFEAGAARGVAGAVGRRVREFRIVVREVLNLD